jgi:DNA-binding transcriptional MerR regulator
MHSISTVCELLGLTQRAVRHYEECGLVRSGRDRFNYRHYDNAACARLEQIGAYRRAGLSIEDISEIFALEDPARRDCVTHKLKARLSELDNARREVETLLQSLGSDRLLAVNNDSEGAHPMALAR